MSLFNDKICEKNERKSSMKKMTIRNLKRRRTKERKATVSGINPMKNERKGKM